MPLSTIQKTEMLKCLKHALKEDIGSGDITTDALIPPSAISHGEFVVKSQGIIAGLDVLPLLFGILDETIIVTKK